MSTVTVSSKIPFGLLLEHAGKKFRIDGCNKSMVRDLNGNLLPGAVGVTEVDAQLWSAWVEANPTHKFLKEGLVYAQKDRKSADAETKEKESLLSGLQGLRQDMKDTRIPQSRFKIEKSVMA